MFCLNARADAADTAEQLIAIATVTAVSISTALCRMCVCVVVCICPECFVYVRSKLRCLYGTHVSDDDRCDVDVDGDVCRDHYENMVINDDDPDLRVSLS